MSAFATTQDLIDLWRPLTTEEEDRAENLLIIVSDELRLRANDVEDLLRDVVLIRNSFESSSIENFCSGWLTI